MHRHEKGEWAYKTSTIQHAHNRWDNWQGWAKVIEARPHKRTPLSSCEKGSQRENDICFKAVHRWHYCLFRRLDHPHHQFRKCVGSTKASWITAIPNNGEWGGCQRTYLGHTAGSDRVAISENRAHAKRVYVWTASKLGMRSFLWTISFYRKFVPRIADYTGLLTLATAKTAPPRVHWTKEMVSAFDQLNLLLSNACVLTVPNGEDSFILQTDASASKKRIKYNSRQRVKKSYWITGVSDWSMTDIISKGEANCLGESGKDRLDGKKEQISGMATNITLKPPGRFDFKHPD